MLQIELIKLPQKHHIKFNSATLEEVYKYPQNTLRLLVHGLHTVSLSS